MYSVAYVNILSNYYIIKTPKFFNISSIYNIKQPDPSCYSSV